MKFDSFEQALAACVSAEDGSGLQEEAMLYCLEHAPDDLKKILYERLVASQSRSSQCNCGHDHPGCKHD